jgi:hypothetical protein
VKCWVVLPLLVLAACSLPQRGTSAPQLVAAAGWRWETIAAGSFDLAVASRPAVSRSPLVVYIEGDGLAYVSATERAMDPTPTDPVALRLALAHPGSGPVAYLARPCQYGAGGAGRNCRSDYWTVARFAPEVVESAGAALDLLAARLGPSRRLILVGYSGGGALAALLAERRSDVVGLVTIAADLDVAAWVEANGLTPLRGSLDPAGGAASLRMLPQVHFTGTADKVVSGDIARSLLRHEPGAIAARMVPVEGQDHACCWAMAWPGLARQPDLALIPGWVGE